ncbi:helicase-related protein [Nonomuraea sp. KM90]|uniref:helicase-related protein n=1 Tax=Nonomuraea sp. KM90 TaxID=3457428 RepID=UPI003FCD4F09
MTLDYQAFLASKRRRPPSSGIACQADDVDPRLFDFQRHIVAWAVRRGRAAIWADTGLGKSRQQIAWADIVTRNVGGRALILAPLAVAEQTVREAAAIGVEVTYVRDQAEADQAPGRIVVTNYDRLHKFDPARYIAVVLDESSILKAFSGTIKRALVKAFERTPYRIACSATPAPNDLEELCNHADFLGVMSPNEMRSTFFIADSRGEFMKYRIKGHAKDAFFDWLATWAIACRTPEDLGFDGAAYELPPLEIRDHLVPTSWSAEGELFTTKLAGITQRAQVRRETLPSRVKAAVELIGSEPDEQWIAWTGLNDEADAITAAIPGAVNVQGSDSPEFKAQALLDFAQGRTRVLVTKAKIAGYGLNLQSCARMVFCGLSDSYEQYYQAIRRCYRFGQQRSVHAHIVLADVEHVIADNVRSKERLAGDITTGLVAAIAAENRRELFAGTSKGDGYEPSRPLTIPDWLKTA